MNKEVKLGLKPIKDRNELHRYNIELFKSVLDKNRLSKEELFEKGIFRK